MNSLKPVDYMPLYIGADVDTGTGVVTLVGVHIDKFNSIERAVLLNGNMTHSAELRNLKPILVPLEKMSEQHQIELIKLECSNMFKITSSVYSDGIDYKQDIEGVWHETSLQFDLLNPAQSLFLFKNKYDLLRLIKSDLAICKDANYRTHESIR